MKGDIFHVLNRGVEKRRIFLKNRDYFRFIHNLHDFNNRDNVLLSYYNRHGQHSYGSRRSVDQLVDVLCWTAVYNHFHLLIIERIDGGAGIYSQKITGGYTLHFNHENKRSGVLFQGKSKIIPVTKDEHFLHLPYYLLSNSIKQIEPNWKEQGIKDFKKVIDFLENYKWSAFQDLSGKENFPLVINRELFYGFFDTNEKKFKKEFINWLKDYNSTEVGDP